MTKDLALWTFVIIWKYEMHLQNVVIMRFQLVKRIQVLQNFLEF